jgi:3-oxoacyl-[acyl-carrier-protein] synthase II
VITGYGVVSQLGVGVGAFWAGLVAGQSAIGPITGFPADDLTPHSAAEVQDLALADPDRGGAFALRAAREAVADSGVTGVEPTRLGVVLARRSAACDLRGMG